ncbi:MAG: L-2-hydroxyglutarate oxidase [Nevskiaceae bacterium]
MFDYVIIGGGIVGLAVGARLLERKPHARLVVLEKEPHLAAHQSGRNSGVIHSGAYYTPGSFKAEFCRNGNRSMTEFCRRHGIPHEICGKLIVAADRSELPRLERLHQRAIANGLSPARVGKDEIKDLEPHVAAEAAIRLPTTGIVDYGQVCRKYADLIRSAGGSIQLDTEVLALGGGDRHLRIDTPRGEIRARRLVNCAGLHSDRVARMAGVAAGARIVPFRGEYRELRPERRHLVRGLVYPVPNPELPFLGVHCARMMDGGVHVGPNAVLAFRREGYERTDFSWRDFMETVAFAGFWRMALRHAGTGGAEMIRAFSRRAFLRAAQRLVPEIVERDLVAAPAGVRAQALRPDGSLVDDFLILRSKNAVHVCNAPSPAATASLEIGRHVVGLLEQMDP